MAAVAGTAMEFATEARIESLRALSARLGANPMLVQANTGNTSLKAGQTMWIKASGTELADAVSADIFVPVDLAQAQTGRYPRRASIETAMHAALPWRVVLHVHSIQAVSWAVRRDGEAQLAGPLRGLNWRWIPYVDSGRPLAEAVYRAWAREPQTDVFILGNHGLVVAGDDCAAAEWLLQEVERRLLVDPRATPGPRVDAIAPMAALHGRRVASSANVQALATDQVARRAIGGGVLFPCQSIFFGPSIPVVPATVPAAEAVVHFRHAPVIVFENACVVVSDELTRHQEQMLHGLAEIARRLQPGCPLRYLDKQELGRLEGGSYVNGTGVREAESLRTPPVCSY